MTDIRKLLKLIETEAQKAAPAGAVDDPKHPRDPTTGQFIDAVTFDRGSDDHEYVPENVPLSDQKRAAFKKRMAELKAQKEKLGKSTTDLANTIADQAGRQILEHGDESEPVAPKNEVELYRAYKGFPHNQNASLLKYIIHRAENVNAYHTPEGAQQADEAFMAGKQKQEEMGRKVFPASKFGIHHSLHELHNLVAQNPDIVNAVLKHRDALHNRLKNTGHVVDINGEPHVILSRSLFGERQKDPLLASYDDTGKWSEVGAKKDEYYDNGVIKKMPARKTHYAAVPLKNVWYSYDAGPKEATYHRRPAQDEYLVSPHEPKVAKQSQMRKMVQPAAHTYNSGNQQRTPAKAFVAAPVTKMPEPQSQPEKQLQRKTASMSLGQLVKSIQVLAKSEQYNKLSPWLLNQGDEFLKADMRKKAEKELKRGKLDPKDVDQLINNHNQEILEILNERPDITKDQYLKIINHPKEFAPGYNSVRGKDADQLYKGVFNNLRMTDPSAFREIAEKGNSLGVARMLRHSGARVNGQDLFHMITKRHDLPTHVVNQAIDHGNFDASHMAEMANHPNIEAVKHAIYKQGSKIEDRTVERLLNDKRPEVRAATLSSTWGNNSNPNVSAEQIERGLNDPHPDVREAAATRVNTDDHPELFNKFVNEHMRGPDDANTVKSMLQAPGQPNAEQMRKIIDYSVANAPSLLQERHLRHQPDTPEDSLIKIASMKEGGDKDGLADIKQQYLGHKNTTANVIQAALNNTQHPELLQTAAAQNAATPEQLRNIWSRMPKDQEKSYRSRFGTLAENPNTPTDVLSGMAQRPDILVHNARRMAIHPNLDPKDLEPFLNSETPDTRLLASRSPVATSEQIMRGVKDKDKTVRQGWMEHPKLGPEHLAIALKDRAPSNREVLAKHPAMTPELLKNLLTKDKADTVRRAALENPNITPELVGHAALNDTNPAIRLAALKHDKAAPELIHQAIDSAPSAELANELRKKKDLTPEHIEKLYHQLAGSKGIDERWKNDAIEDYLQHPNAPESIRQHFLSNNDWNTIHNTMHPDYIAKMSPEQLRAAYNKTTEGDAGGWKVRDAVKEISEHPAFGASGLLNEFANSPERDVREYAAMSPQLTPELARKLVNDPGRGIPERVLQNLALPEDIMDEVVSKPVIEGPHGRKDLLSMALAQNPNLKERHVLALGAHEQPEVREAAVSHPSAPESLIMKAVNDSDEAVASAAGKQLGHHNPDAYNKALSEGQYAGQTHEVELHPATEKLKHLKGQIEERGGTVHKNELPNKGQGLPGQVFDGKGNISTDTIEKYLSSLPKTRYNISHDSWGGAQRHDDNQLQHVIQLNMTNDHVKQLKDQGLFDTFKKMHESSHYSGHPTKMHSLGWARVDDSHPGHWHIDEIQSDFGQGMIRQIEKAKAEGEAAQLERKFGMPADQIASNLTKIGKIFSGPFKNINHAISGAVHEVARKKGVKSTSMDTLKDQAEQSGMDTVGRTGEPPKALPGHMINTYKQVPEDLGYTEKPKKEVMPSTQAPETHVQYRKLVKSLQKLKIYLEALHKSDDTGALAGNLKTVTLGRHTAGPGKNATATMPHPAKPTTPKNHVRADTMTHQDFHYELGKSVNNDQLYRLLQMLLKMQKVKNK